ncbi:YetF domain-containing protein [Bacillus sp. AK128]
MSIAELAIRMILAFSILLLVTRVTGRKEISQMTFFNFVSAITIGTIGGALVTSNAFSIRNGVLAIVGWGLLTLAMGIIDIKSKKARKVIEGVPKIVIKQGKILEGVLREVRLDLDELTVMLRKKNVFSLTDVEYAIFETDGTLSVMKTQPKQPLTKSDMGNNTKMQTKYPLATGVIFDGEINQQNLSKLNLDQHWLSQQLKSSGIQSVSDVFYAEVQQDGSLYVDERDDVVH